VKNSHNTSKKPNNRFLPCCNKMGTHRKDRLLGLAHRTASNRPRPTSPSYPRRVQPPSSLRRCSFTPHRPHCTLIYPVYRPSGLNGWNQHWKTCHICQLSYPNELLLFRHLAVAVSSGWASDHMHAQGRWHVLLPTEVNP
jgi:hypothetical protein